jgi:hypothetical protein
MGCMHDMLFLCNETQVVIHTWLHTVLSFDGVALDVLASAKAFRYSSCGDFHGVALPMFQVHERPDSPPFHQSSNLNLERWSTRISHPCAAF